MKMTERDKRRHLAMEAGLLGNARLKACDYTNAMIWFESAAEHIKKIIELDKETDQ